jgi:Family of unknown function (DUF6174)
MTDLDAMLSDLMHEQVRNLTVPPGAARTALRRARRTHQTRIATIATAAAVLGVGAVAFAPTRPGRGVAATPRPTTQPASGAPAEAQARAHWAARRPSSYSFTVDSRCGERALIGRFAVNVVGGQVSTARGLDSAAASFLATNPLTAVPTLDGLLDELDAARRAHADRATAVFDATDGHPVRIDIDYSLRAIDDEACYLVSAYSRTG